MFPFLSFLRTSFLTVLLAGAAALPGAAQTQIQARQYNTSTASTYGTTNPGRAVDVDESLVTAATLKPALLLGGAALRVAFPTTIQPGGQVIIYLKPDAGLLDASLGSMTVRTYKGSASADPSVQQVPLADDALVDVSLLQGAVPLNKVTFAATQSFDQLELRVAGLLNASSSIDVYGVFATVNPLPVQLTAFQGKATAAGVVLKWETASEQNAEYFEVQRAERLTDGFSPLGRVASTGTSAQAHTYQFVDAQATGLQYYRLRQVDSDGSELFSPVVAVSAGPLARLVAYPTLATDLLTVVAPAGAQLHVFNQQGQQMQMAASPTSQPQQLDVRSLPGGVYILRDAATGQSTRFIKSSER